MGIDETTRSEDELRIGTEVGEAGAVHLRKHVDVEHTARAVPRSVEQGEVERVAAAATDSGEVETLPDGSVSVPVFEEQLVVEKRMVVRERIIVRKYTVTEDQVVEADLRRERVEVVADESVGDRVHEAPPAGGATPAATPGPGGPAPTAT